MESPLDRETRLRRIADSVAALSPDEENELLRILVKHDCGHTRNTNGVFVNLSEAQPNAMEEIERFLQFSAMKKTELDTYDRMRERMREESVAASALATASALEAARAVGPKGSVGPTSDAVTVLAYAPPPVSAMRREATRFTALKKKYSKPLDPLAYMTPKLQFEAY